MFERIPFWSKRRASSKPLSRHRLPLRLESLEDRVMPAMLFVVPTTQANDTTSFATLNAALGAAHNGDTIMIQANTTPGSAVVNKSVLIEAQSTKGQAQIGSLELATNGVTLQKLNLGTVTIDNGVTGETIENSTVGSITQNAGGLVNGGNVIAHNQINGFVFLGNFSFIDNADNFPAAAGDQILDNVINATSTEALTALNDNAVLIQGNTIHSSLRGAVGIFVGGLQTNVSGNNVTLTGGGGGGVLLGLASQNGSYSVQGNTIEVTQGFGIAIVKNPGFTLQAKIANNNLVNNLVGVGIFGDGSSNADALGTVDLGGGSLGSMGGNNFTGYNGVNGHFAIVTDNNGAATSDAVFASNNIFSTKTPSTVVQAKDGAIDFTQLTTLFVVPASQANGVTKFATLGEAIAAAINGDTIMIQANAVPGSAVVNKSLLIEGMGTIGKSQIGSLELAANGITLQKLNLGAVNIDNGATGETIENSTVVNIGEMVGTQVNGGNVIAHNQIVGSVFLLNRSLPNSPADVGDQVIDNVFKSVNTFTPLLVENETGVLIQGNTIQDSGTGAAGIALQGDVDANVSKNTISLTGSGSTGVVIANGQSCSYVFQGNTISTNKLGTGILIQKAGGFTLQAKLSNNNLVNNLVGVEVFGDGSSNADALGTVDLGGGSLGSMGGNNFTGYNGVNGHVAVETKNGGMATSDIVFALNNQFSTTPSMTVEALAGIIDAGAAPGPPPRRGH